MAEPPQLDSRARKKQTLKRGGYFLLRSLISAALLYFLLALDWIDPARIEKGFQEKPWHFAGGTAFTFICYNINVARLQILLGLPLLGLLRAHLIGQFLGLLLPGGLSADVVKGYYIRKNSQNIHWKEIIGSIVLDRFFGFYSMTIFAILIMLAGQNWIKDSRLMKILFLIYCFLFLGASLLLLAGSRLQSIGFLRPLLRRLENHMPLELIDRITWSGFLTMILLGLISYIFYTYALVFAAGFFSYEEGFLKHALTIPGITLVHMAPLTPAGLGIGELSGEILYREIGPGGGSEIVLALHLFMVVTALLGLPAYLFSSGPGNPGSASSSNAAGQILD
ncbi:MAG: flippase-like domain-containing protein [Spirochaetales bacterium]|nr:flippase-like domain-containing protein [Spirochaetales bacterium]